jgi:adenine phosphoribosyltransferase
MTDSISTLYAAIRDVRDFPKPGITFKDVTPILANSRLFDQSIELFRQVNHDSKIDKVVGIDARGFIFGAAAATLWVSASFPYERKANSPMFQSLSPTAWNMAKRK